MLAPTTEMCRDHPPRRGREFRHLPADVIVGDAVVAPMAQARIADVLGKCIGLRHFRHRSMERAIEAGDLRQARERLGERSSPGHIEGLVRRFHQHERVEIGQHIRVDPHGRLVPRPPSTTRWPAATTFAPARLASSHVMTKCSAVLWSMRVAFAPLMGAHGLAGRVADDEMRISLQAVDPSAAEQWQRSRFPPHRRRTSGWSNLR